MASFLPGPASVSSGEAETRDDDDDLDPIENWDALSLPPREDETGVWEHVYQHGRRYHLYKDGRYPMPNDDVEQDRENMKHCMMLQLTVCKASQTKRFVASCCLRLFGTY